jgi:argininosuccinate synthase
MTLPRELIHFKRPLEQKFADMTYNGGWFDPLMDALRAFMAETQKRVSGTVRLKFYKGSCVVAGRKSDDSLYDFGWRPMAARRLQPRRGRAFRVMGPAARSRAKKTK